jgi:hypothetical protein
MRQFSGLPHLDSDNTVDVTHIYVVLERRRGPETCGASGTCLFGSKYLDFAPATSLAPLSVSLIVAGP